MNMIMNVENLMLCLTFISHSIIDGCNTDSENNQCCENNYLHYYYAYWHRPLSMLKFIQFLNI